MTPSDAPDMVNIEGTEEPVVALGSRLLACPRPSTDEKSDDIVAVPLATSELLEQAVTRKVGLAAESNKSTGDIAKRPPQSSNTRTSGRSVLREDKSWSCSCAGSARSSTLRTIAVAAESLAVVALLELLLFATPSSELLL
jgi:hypothetical protein